MGTTFITEEDISYLLSSGSKIAQFCVRCNRGLQEFNLKRLGKNGFDLPDPAAIASALFPEIIQEAYDAFAYVEYKSESAYGQIVIDSMGLLNRSPNARICKTLDGKKFKDRLFQYIV